MSEVLSYVDRPIAPIQAMLIGPTNQDIEDARVWARSLFGNDAVPAPNAMTQFMVIIQTGPDQFVQTSSGSYLCWDGETLRVMDKSIFEFLKVPSA